MGAGAGNTWRRLREFVSEEGGEVRLDVSRDLAWLWAVTPGLGARLALHVELLHEDGLEVDFDVAVDATNKDGLASPC